MNWYNATINERIRYILADLFDNNVTAMAKASFISRSSINNIVGDAETLPGYEIIRKLLEMKKGIVNPEWLILGNGRIYKSSTAEQMDDAKRNNGVDVEKIELVPELPIDAAAGFTDDIQSGITPSMCNMLPRVPGLPSYDLTISVRGDSMEPTFASGDRLAIRRCYDIIEWGAPHVLDTSEGVYIKRIKDDATHGNVVCISDNTDYPQFSIPKACIRGLYKVVALLRVC